MDIGVENKDEAVTVKELLEIKVNTSVCFGSHTILRVPGGWIYDGKQDVFVPEPK